MTKSIKLQQPKPSNYVHISFTCPRDIANKFESIVQKRKLNKSAILSQILQEAIKNVKK